MLTNRKNIGILIIASGLILIILIIYLVWFRKMAAIPEPAAPLATTTAQLPSEPTVGTTTPGDKPRNRQTYDLSKEAPHVTTADDLGKIAMAFSERFGSFSNQSGYDNITDLKIRMTASLKTWADTYVTQLTKQYKNEGVFYGITTRALVYAVNSFDDKSGQAQIIVTTQRTEQVSQKVYNQKMDLNFLKVNGEWLINEVYWEK
ncbi:MAG: hypothetical protein WC249_02770 [Patescibacteria group bacterium]|jgi:hypothetical protein